MAGPSCYGGRTRPLPLPLPLAQAALLDSFRLMEAELRASYSKDKGDR